MNRRKIKRVIKNGRQRTKLNPFEASGLPQRPYEWKEKLPELFLIAGLLEKQSVKEVVGVFQSVRNLVGQNIENGDALGFAGGVSELGKLVEGAEEPLRDRMSGVLRDIFCGMNLSLLKVLDVPGKQVLSDILGGFEKAVINDILAVMHVTGAALHGQSGRATRAKLVQLMLWDPDGARFHCDFERFGKLATGRDDDVLKEVECGFVRASWSAIQGCKDERVTPWVKSFWGFGLDTPCSSP